MEKDDTRRIAVTYTSCVQVGVESYRDKSITRIFPTHEAIEDIFIWAKAMGVQNPRINDFIFSDVVD